MGKKTDSADGAENTQGDLEAAAQAAAAEAAAQAAAEAAAAEAAAQAAAQAAAPIEVRVLVDCAYGRCNSVALVPGAELAAAKADSLVDDHPDAVAYAKSLAAEA